MTPQEFATKIREKYPAGIASDGRAYADIPDDELSRKIVEKFPVYASQVTLPDVVAPKPAGLSTSLKENLSKIPGQIGKAASAVGDFLGLKPLGEGLGKAVFQLTPEFKQLQDALAKGVITQDQFDEVATGKLNAKEVLGSAAQAALLPISAGLKPAVSLVGKLAQGAIVGGATGAASTAAKDGTTEEIIQNAELGAGLGAAIPLAGEGIRQFGKLLGATGDKIQFSVIKPTQADIKDGFSIETVKKYGLGGSLKSSFEKTDLKLDELSKELNDKLNSSNASLNLDSVYENTVKKLLGNKMENFGSNTSVENAIEQLRSEINAVSGPNGVVSIPEAQTVKRAAGHFGAWLFGANDPEATARQRVYNAFYGEIKNAIEKNSPEGVREINKQLSELIPVMNALIRRIPVAERNSALSLTDVISLTAATVEPRALALSLANFASKSGRVGAALSAAGEKVSGFSAPNAGNAARTAITSLLGTK